MPSPSPTNKRLIIGLILPASLTYARHILSGISEGAHDDPRIKLHLFSENGELYEGFIPPQGLSGILAFTAQTGLPQVRKLHPHVVAMSNRHPITEGDFVVTDDVEVGRMGAEYFLQRGFRNFAYLDSSSHQYSRERREGFEARLREADMPAPTIIAVEQDRHKRIPRLVNELTVPCAVFAANDIVARIFMDLIPDPHEKIPARIALLGVDNDSLHRSLSVLPLSSIELDGAQVGRLALRLLLDRIAHPDKPDQVLRVPPLRIHSRLSTDVYEVEDPRVVEALEVMDQHLTEIHSIHDLVDRLNIPRRTLEIHFRNCTGRSPAKHLAQLRLERARDLLRSTRLSIDQVAEETGYSDARLLWQHFKKVYSQTPSAFRKSLNEV
jgi:LacI family transcriptional regulator